MKNSDILNLYAALSELSVEVQVIHEGKPVNVRPNWSGKTALAIARAKLALKPHKEAAEEARNEIVKAYGGNVQPDHPKFVEAVNKVNDVMSCEAQVEIPKLSLAEVSEQQGLNPNVLEILLPHLE